MSRSLAEYMRLQKRAYRTAADRRPLSPEERKALHTVRQEARQAGAKLERPGRGPLPPSLVLAVLRRDRYACTGQCDTCAGPLTVHHRTPGGGNRLDNLETLCRAGHDRFHAV